MCPFRGRAASQELKISIRGSSRKEKGNKLLGTGAGEAQGTRQTEKSKANEVYQIGRPSKWVPYRDMREKPVPTLSRGVL